MLIAPVEMTSTGAMMLFCAEPHDRALAELFFDLANGGVERLHSFLSFPCFFNWWHVFGSFRDATDPRNAPSESQA